MVDTDTGALKSRFCGVGGLMNMVVKNDEGTVTDRGLGIKLDTSSVLSLSSNGLALTLMDDAESGLMKTNAKALGVKVDPKGPLYKTKDGINVYLNEDKGIALDNNTKLYVKTDETTIIHNTADGTLKAVAQHPTAMLTNTGGI